MIQHHKKQEDREMNNSKTGWYLLCLSVGGILGIAMWNLIG